MAGFDPKIAVVWVGHVTEWAMPSTLVILYCVHSHVYNVSNLGFDK